MSEESKKTRILLVDDEEMVRAPLKKLLNRKGYHVTTAKDGLEALEKSQQEGFDIVITDLIMPKMGGLMLLSELKTEHPELIVTVLSGKGTIESAVQAIKYGASDYIEKPVDPENFLEIIKRCTEQVHILKQDISIEHERRKDYRFENIVGQTKEMHNLFSQIKSVANSDASVLIGGDNGSGKELIADAIHYRSGKKVKPIIKVNCGALPDNIVESELFGHEKGAFTGAVSRQIGKIESANGGTLFLDEIGELTMNAQVKLLRVLETKEFQRVGGHATIKVDFRLVSATNKNLVEAVMNKEFREDLYYRINTVTITSPSLRERKGDIPLLANYFLKMYSKKEKKSITKIVPTALSLLMRYSWPGNVRELSHAIERSVIFCNGSELKPEHLPDKVKETGSTMEISINSPTKALAAVEMTLIKTVLEENNWNLKKTAQSLDIARGTLYSKMEKYGILKPDSD